MVRLAGELRPCCSGVQPHPQVFRAGVAGAVIVIPLARSYQLTNASRAMGWRLVQEPGDGGYVSEGVASGVGVERARIPGCCSA